MLEFDGEAVVDCAGLEIVEEFLLSLCSLFLGIYPRGHDGKDEVNEAEGGRRNCHDIASEGEPYSDIGCSIWLGAMGITDCTTNNRSQAITDSVC